METVSEQITKMIDDEAEQGKAELINGSIEKIDGDASKKEGLTRTQYRDWMQSGGITDRKERQRGRSERRETSEGNDAQISCELR